MNTVAIACALACLVSIAEASQDFVVLTTESRAWGDWVDTTNSDTFSFVSTDTAGIYTNVQSLPKGVNKADISISPFALSLRASSPAWVAIPGPRIDVFARSITRFSPLGDGLTLTISGRATFNYYANEQDMEFTLKDLDASNTLFHYRASDDWGEWIGESTHCIFSLPVDPTHSYELTVHSWVSAWDAKYAILSAVVDIDVVPEPRSASLLLLAFLHIFACSIFRKGQKEHTRAGDILS